MGYTNSLDTERRLQLLSPLDHRYYIANPLLFDTLSSYLSEEAHLAYCIKVELALLEELGLYFKIDNNILSKSLDNCKTISFSEITKIESQTHHQIRALITVLKQHVDPSIRHLIHLGATSSDIIDTAQSLRIKECFEQSMLPYCVRLQQALIQQIRVHAHTPQIGRTHGQFAVPMTFGHFFAEYCSRLGDSLHKLIATSKLLAGQLSGAIGTYTAFSLFHDEPLELEKRVMTRLNLRISEHSTQIAAPEALTRFFLELNVYFSILANLADDMRNLQRSEIGELHEFFESNQDGSSAMPHKKNPWNSEHIKSMYKHFSPYVNSFYNDLISEHQRDLTNSASRRFYSEYIAGFMDAVARACKLLESLHIDTQKSSSNLAVASEHAHTEVFYILLASSGQEQAHTIIKDANFAAHAQDKDLVTYLKENNPQILKAINDQLEISPAKKYFNSAQDILAKITNYGGLSSSKSLEIATRHQQRVDEIRSEYVIKNDRDTT